MKTIKRIVGVFLFALTIALVAPSVMPVNENIHIVEAATKINKKKVTLIKGQTTTLKITGTQKKIKWSSSKKSVASVSSKGKVTAKKKGTATITAKVGSKKYTCDVSVQVPKISKTKLTMYVGDSETLSISGTDQKITWKSSNKSIATVSSVGKIKAKKAGTVTITATILKKKYTCKITVKKAIEVNNISLNETSLYLKEGDVKILKCSVSPSNAKNMNVTWISTDSSIVEVDLNGKIKAVSPGRAVVSAKCGGKTAECYIYVQSSFDESDALSKLSYESYRLNHGIAVIVKNNYKYDIYLDADAIFYDEYGIMIGKRNSCVYCLESGKTNALLIYNPYDSNYEEIDFDTYKLSFKISESSFYGCSESISFTSNYGIDNVMVNVKNNGKETDSTELTIVFYKNNIPIGIDSKYAEVESANESDVLQFDFPYDRNYNAIYPDSYKIFVSSFTY